MRKLSAKLEEARREFTAAQERYVEKKANGKRAKKAHREWHECRMRCLKFERKLESRSGESAGLIAIER